MTQYTTLEEWLDIFYEAWQPQSGDEATAGRKAYGELRDVAIALRLKQEGD